MASSAALAWLALTLGGLGPGWYIGLLSLGAMEAAGLVRGHAAGGARGLQQLRFAPDGRCWAGWEGTLRPVRCRCLWTWPAVALGLEFLPLDGGRRQRALLFRDQVDPSAWRRLLVRCRQANPQAMT